MTLRFAFSIPLTLSCDSLRIAAEARESDHHIVIVSSNRVLSDVVSYERQKALKHGELRFIRVAGSLLNSSPNDDYIVGSHIRRFRSISSATLYSFNGILTSL